MSRDSLFHPFSIHLAARKHRPQTAPVDKMQSTNDDFAVVTKKVGGGVCVVHVLKDSFLSPLEFSHTSAPKRCAKPKGSCYLCRSSSAVGHSNVTTRRSSSVGNNQLIDVHGFCSENFSKFYSRHRSFQ